MNKIISQEDVDVFLGEFRGGADSCLREFRSVVDTWVDRKGSMHFGNYNCSLEIVLQGQPSPHPKVKICFNSVFEFHTNGMSKNGFDGIIQDIVIDSSVERISFTAKDSSYDDAYVYFCVVAKEMSWMNLNHLYVSGDELVLS